MRVTGVFRVTGPESRTVFDRVHLPSTYFSRLRGLIGHPPPLPNEAWWFRDCSAIHTMGMSYAIDVIHLALDGCILRITPGLQPARWSACLSADHLLEVGSGVAEAMNLHLGDRLEYVR